jgi:HKD family nuclease
MQVQILLQPFNSQGLLSRLGINLAAQLMSGAYLEVHILSAYVTSSGTQRLANALQAITAAGGQVHALIGVDNGLTSMQAVADLHAAGVEVLGFHTGGSILYHPKVYLLKGPHRAWLSVGSSNLTGDGMYRNIETNTLIDLNLALPGDLQIANETVAWFQRFRTTYARNTLRLTPQALQGFLQSGTLVDEIEKSRQRRSANAAGVGSRRMRIAVAPRFIVPALPAATGQRPIRRRRGPQVVEENSAPAPSTQTRFFAMILSAHDASKKTGMPGTPELSLPRPARDFFPPMKLSGRQYPDAYFDVRLNDGAQAKTVNYRIWERPPGGSAGHADLRINIKHETVDLTTNGGGDIIFFEASPDAEGPAYEVWVVKPADANYNSIRDRCTHEVAAHGAGEAKRFGFF